MTRKHAFETGLTDLRARRRALLKNRPKTSAPAQKRYDGRGMIQPDQIIEGDCIKILRDAPAAWADLVFADPPFNIGYLYHGYDDQRKAEDYLQFSRDWMQAVHRALRPNGSFYLAIGDEYCAELCVIAKQLGFIQRNWIIWHYTFGQHMKRKFTRSHTHILYFVKEAENFTFNADAVRVASARKLIYADARANPKGRLPDDVWYLRPQETSGEYFVEQSDTWWVSRICGTFKEREGWHGCQMPIQVLNRIILASSDPGDVVLDPFNGSGTTVVSAALLGRKYVGIDQSAEYVAFARKRLEHAVEQAGKAPASAPDASMFEMSRESRVQTPTDSLGRKRVPRRRANPAKVIAPR